MSEFKSTHIRIMQIALCILATMLVNNVGPSLAAYERVCNSPTRQARMGICGSSLTDMIILLCNTPGLRDQIMRSHKQRFKRSPEKALAMKEGLRAITLSPQNALSYLTKRSMTGTIVCECCIHQCNPREMLEYCNGFGEQQNLGKRGISTSDSSLQDSTIDDPGYY